MRGRAGKKMAAILFTTQSSCPYLAHIIIIIHVKYFIATYIYIQRNANVVPGTYLLFTRSLFPMVSNLYSSTYLGGDKHIYYILQMLMKNIYLVPTTLNEVCYFFLNSWVPKISKKHFKDSTIMIFWSRNNN